MKTRFIHHLLLAGLLLISGVIQSQPVSGVVKGRVVDTKNQPVAFATAALLNPQTTQIAKGVMCNEKGEFLIDKTEPGEYILSVRMLGFNANESEHIEITRSLNIIEKVVILTETVQQLQETVIAGKYDFVEQAVDKTIINPNASIISSSESIYEILKKTPGVFIDDNDNISLKGMQGVQVMIDNKPTYVSGKDLAPLLKGMLGKNVKNIEIIENPSARYDAEGISGIININTKHNQAPGFNGSFNSGLTITRSLSENAGIILNANFGKINAYGNYSFSNWERWHSLDVKRRFIAEDMSNSYLLMDSEDLSNGNSHNYKAGIDYLISKTQVLSIMLRGGDGIRKYTDFGNSAFADGNMTIDSTLTNISDGDYHWNNKTFNVNYKWDIDSTGKTLIADADYAHFYTNSGSHLNSRYFDNSGEEMDRNSKLENTQKGDIDIVSVKLDYTHPINKIYSFETGIKGSFVKTDSRANMAGYYQQDDNFVFEENIQAAYINTTAQYAKTTVQIGLRIENTISTGKSLSLNQIDKKNYLNLFPSVFVQQTLEPKQTIGFRYSYRIGRPNYHDLNPFIWINDPYTYNLGNPMLNPQFTHTLSVNHNYKSKLMTSVGYNYTRDLLTEVIYNNDSTKAIYQTRENLGSSVDFNISETVQFQPATWWRISGTLTGMYKEVNSKHETGDHYSQWSCIGNVSNNFTLPYKISMELSANYMSKQLIGNFILKSRQTIDLGLKRNVLHDKGSLRISFSDIFNTGSTGATIKTKNVYVDVDNQFETQRLNISFTYRFGKSEFKTRSNRSTASSEEEGRSAK